MLGLVLAFTALAAGGEPDLPAGLEESDTEAPSLPAGLDEEGPELPAGLDEAELEEEAPEAPEPQRAGRWLDLTGFWEIRGGVRTQHDSHQRAASLAETRLQLEWEKDLRAVSLKVTADLLYDAVLDRHRVNLDEGRGLLDLRQVNLTFSPASWMDVKVGRQILTWGTGDLLFVNDLFPKDWQAFFIGRDVQYLKAPSDAIKVSAFGPTVNVDVVFTPCFDADRFIRGERISLYNPALGRRSGRDAVIRADRPDRCFEDHETALRIWRTLDGYELAAYAYHGFWKSPAGSDPVTGKVTFPDLTVYGGSIRGPAAGGIANLELGYYDSRDDPGGSDPLTRNSELRVLVGYERDLPQLGRDLTVGMQYYLEWMMNHADYRRTLPPGARAADEGRHVLTWRITKLLMDQNLRLSLFAFYSPSDDDAYLRPNLQYKIDDHWTAECGANVFVGSDNRSFFAQFETNTNVYASLRYGF